MKKVILLCSLFIMNTAFAQNLVPNNSFEQIDSCNFSANFLATGWFSGTDEDTPDLYHTCATVTSLQPPTVLGCQNLTPRTGDAYAGLIVYGTYNREYVQIELTEPLKVGQTYYLEFFVSPTDQCSGSAGFTDAIGMGFSDTLIVEDIPNNSNDPISPNVIAFENLGPILSNSGTWTKLSHCYTARGDEKVVIIGNFRTDAETSFASNNAQGVLQNYMFVDDVSVIQFDDLVDTVLLCDNDVTIDGELPGYDLTWNTGEVGNSITVTSGGNYVATVNYEGCPLTDTTYVFDIREVEEFSFESTFCENQTNILKPNIPGEYVWSTGSTSNQIEVTENGMYQATVTNECDTYIFDYDVEIIRCDCDVFVPTAFTPNNDANNDDFRPFFGCDFRQNLVQFSVYDNWGNEVFRTTDINNTWNGEFKNQPLDSGVYVWMILYEETVDGVTEEKQKSGEVVLIR